MFEEQFDALADNLRAGFMRRLGDSFTQGTAEDQFGAATRQAHSDSFPVVIGMVVGALPHLHWYRVKLASLQGTVPCCMLMQGTSMPMGVHQSVMAQPGQPVLVMLPPGATKGYIVGAVPPQIVNAGWKFSDWVNQGSGVGLLREGFYRAHIEDAKNWGLTDWSGQRPIDGLVSDWSLTSCTGINFTISPFEAQLRVSEACGLFLNYFDGYLRLAGLNVDLQYVSRLLQARNDKGELGLVEEDVVFPWEAAGQYGPNVSAFQENDPKTVQREKAVGATDLEEGGAAAEVFSRRRKYGGYAGQGGLEFVVAPPQEEGTRKMSDAEQEHDKGVFQEFITLDGAKVTRSVKSITSVKRGCITAPRRARMPEDPQGDDDDYKYSGEFGDGVEHKVTDPVRPSGALSGLVGVADVLDTVARLCNWQALHPFHYHEKDYALPEESELDDDRSQQHIDFGQLAQTSYLIPTEAEQIFISNPIGDSKTFRIESLIHQDTDGTVVLQNGYGTRLLLGPGNIQMSAAGNVEVISGSNVIISGRDIIGNAAKNIDLTASDGDARLKGEKNVHVLGGNDGLGGVLIESKGVGSTFDYDGKYGADVTSPGIVLLSKRGVIASLGDHIYQRAGVEGRSGIYTIDAGGGNGQVSMRASQIDAYALQSMSIWHLTSDTSGEIERCHYFRKESSRIDGMLRVGGPTFIDGTLTTGKTITTGGGVLARGSMAHRGSNNVGRSEPFEQQIDDLIREYQEQLTADPDLGEEIFKAFFTELYDAQAQLGNLELHEKIGFSFRDDPDQVQYRSVGYKLFEPWFQQMERFGMADGLEERVEKPVLYQGRNTYPFPGQKVFESQESLIYPEDPKLYDAAAGRCKDRGSDYETYEHPELKKEQLLGSPKIVS